MTVTLDGSGTLATSQWTAFTNATAAISGGNPDFSSLANINGAGFQVSGGATVSLPTVTSYSGPIGDAIKLQASGVGSLLSLPNLTTITGDTGNFVSLTQAQALSGGQVSLPALTQIGGGPVALVADGTGSQLDVSALTSFQGAGGQYHTTSLQVTNGGTLLDALLTTLSGVTVTLDGSGTLATSQWTAFTNATAAISGGNPDFSSLANINGAGFQVSGGATVSLPTVTSYSGPIGDAIKLQASGVGSLLSLPNLTTITGDTGNFVSLTQAQALSGGQVSLPALTQIGGGPVALVADGTGSQLDVSALTSFQGAGGQYHTTSLQVTNGGTLLDALLTTLSGVTVTLDGSGTLATSQWTAFTNATAAISGGNPDFSSLANINGAGFQVSGGATVSLPTVTSYSGPIGDAIKLQASGVGSLLSLPSLLNIGINTEQLDVTALGGGRAEFSALTSITSGDVRLHADGAGSVVSAPDLVHYSISILNNVQQTNGGAVLLASVPDLAVGTVSAPSSVVLGQPVTVSWTDVNQGDADATGEWVDRVYLYTSSSDLNPTLVASVPFNSALSGGETANLSSTIDLPLNLIGTFYFGVTANYFQGIGAQHATIASQPTEILAPDLTVGTVQTSATAVQFGQALTIDWTVTNHGNAPASGIWSDRLYLSTQPTLNASSSILLSQLESGNSPLGAARTLCCYGSSDAADFGRTREWNLLCRGGGQRQSIARRGVERRQPGGQRPAQLNGAAAASLGGYGIVGRDAPGLRGSVLKCLVDGYQPRQCPGHGSVDRQCLPGDRCSGRRPDAVGHLHEQCNALARDFVQRQPSDHTARHYRPILARRHYGRGRCSHGTEYRRPAQSDRCYSAVNRHLRCPGADWRCDVFGRCAVALAGTAYNPATNQSVADVPVIVQIATQGTLRGISATTDAQGNFATTFYPLSTEAGLYQYGAGPDADHSVEQGQFEIAGMSISSQPAVNVAPGVPLAGSATLTNLGSVPLTGLTADVVNAPANIHIQASLGASTLAGLGSTALNFQITASDASVSQANVLVLVRSNEGALAELTLPITVLPLVPRLVAQPGTLIDGMVVGRQTLETFTVVNNGGAASGPLQVLLPKADWLTLASAPTIDSLAPGQSATVTLELAPAADLALGSYTGSIAIVGQAASINVPFQFRAVSTATGNLLVDAQDEMTFYSHGSPLVAGAIVTLSDPLTGATIASGTTGADGTLEIDQILVGSYNILVDASGHNQYRGSIAIQPGQTNTVDAFLSSQLVTYQWNVTPTTIPDQYTFTVDTTFKTNVPIPVITVSPAFIDFSTLTADTTEIDFTITNNGLLAANNLSLAFNNSGGYTITPLVGNLGTLPAMSERTVPVLIQRNLMANALASPASEDGNPPDGGLGDCGGGIVTWTLLCGDENHTYGDPIRYVNVPGCGPFPASGYASTDGEGLGLVDFQGANNTKSLNICDPKDLLKLLKATFDEATAVAEALVIVAEIVGVEVKGPVIAIVARKALTKAAARDWPGVGTAFLGLIKRGFGSAWGFAETMNEVRQDLIDPPRNVTPEFLDAIDRLSMEVDRVRVVADAFTEFFGSVDWLSLTDGADASNEPVWLQAFLQAGTAADGTCDLISSDQATQLLALPLPTPVTTSDAANAIARWNNTVLYNTQGIYNLGDVPPGQSTNFIAQDVMVAKLVAAENALVAIDGEGFTNIYDGATAAANAAIDAFTAANDTGICGAVSLKIGQQATLARSAFDASLELDNNKPNPLQNISVTLHIVDVDGNDASSLFYIASPALNGITAVDGSGSLAANSHGTSDWTLIPTDAAAAHGISQYFVSGTIAYDDNGYDVSMPLLPTQITVYPNPSLHVQYFLPHDVYGDDPFTPQVETPQPFALGIMVTNNGPGDAGNFTITSAQPKIFDNQKGLLVDFNIVGAQVDNQPATPSLTIDMGSIASGRTVVGAWQMTSSLDGQFISYDASYQHDSRLGGVQTSLIDSVDIHDTVHVVQPHRPGDDGNPAFLVDSQPSATDLPDTLYLANGTTAPVGVASSIGVDGPVTLDHLQVQLSALMTSGWSYIQFPDPGVGFRLAKVVRSDGTPIPVGPDAWTTHPVDSSIEVNPTDDLFHLLDCDGTGSYTLYYLPVNAGPPAVTGLAPVVPNPATGPVSSVNVTFDEQIDPTTLNLSGLSLNLDGGPNLINSGVTLTAVSGTTYQINGLGPLTAPNGVYQLTVSPGAVQDYAGETSTGTVSEKWADGDVGPYIVALEGVSPDPRNTPVESVDVTFDESVDPTTFDYHDLTLTLDGGPNLINGSVTIVPVAGSPDAYRIAGLSTLTAAAGIYRLAVDAAGVADLYGAFGRGN